MPNDNDNRLANAQVDVGLFGKLQGYHAYPSNDGEKLYSMVVANGTAPVFIEADRMQVAASLQEANMAHYLMTRRAGTDISLIPDEAWILKPRMDCSRIRYNPITRHLSLTLCFTDRLPLPISISLEDWKRLKAKTDAVCGSIAHLLALLAIIVT